MMLGLVCALAGCGDGAADRAVIENRVEPETGATAQVAKLDADLRNGVFAKAIRDSGAACPEVTESARAEIRHGVRGWKAQCNNESAHLIQILPDGTAKVTSRTN
jgi:carboxylesterase type B